MKVYDDIIRETLAKLEGLPSSFAPFGAPAEEGSKNELVLRHDAAFELGEASFDSVCYTAVTSSEALVPEDGTVVIGRDLGAIHADCAFARIALIRTDDIASSGDEAAYAVIKNIDLKKYSVSAKGYMVRASAMSNREQVRVAKSAVAAGLDFAAIGSLYIKRYRENPHVKAVRIIFVTLPDAPFAALDKLAVRADTVTKALDHALSDVSMNCRACEWKPVCDSVEGMKQEHERIISSRK